MNDLFPTEEPPLTELELYKELGELTRNRDRWEAAIPQVSALLTHESNRVVRIHCLGAIRAAGGLHKE